MALDYQTLKNWRFAETSQTFTRRDTILYALGLGFGSDPGDANQLRFVYERGLRTVPTMGAILATAAGWVLDPKAGIDLAKLLHGEQSLILHRPLPVEGTVIGRGRMIEIYDKGAGKAALAYFACDLSDAASGDLLCTSTIGFFVRGEGGFGGPDGPGAKPPAIPERPAEEIVDIATLPQQALIYRLSGDLNPLHADPKMAAAAGFPRPILHGMCTYGIAGRVILTRLCAGDPARLKRLDARFSAPVFPGETVRTEIWRERDGTALFRSKVLERDTVVLTNGYAEINPS